MTEATEDYQRRVIKLLDGIEYGPKRVLTITEPEMLALDGPDARRVTPMLRLGSDMPEGERERLVEETASRLFAAGETEDGTPLGGPDSVADEPTARTVLRMRRSWLGVLLIDQNASIGRQFITVYLRADRRAMTEVTSPEGKHEFAVMKRAVALDAASQFLTPFPESAQTDEDGMTYPMATWIEDAQEHLAPAKVASTVISRRQDRQMQRRVEDRFALYNFDDRTEIFFAETPERVRIAPISRLTLRDRLEEISRPIDIEGDTDV